MREAFTQGGRAASMARRRNLSQGKAGLPVIAERASRGRHGPISASASPPPMIPPATIPPVTISGTDRGHANGHNAARTRRAELSLHGRGVAAPAPPSRPSREGKLEYTVKVVTSPTQGGQSVTGPRTSAAANVTGTERGSALPISGSQYIGADAGAGWRASAAKVGLSRTAGGNVVSGAQVRSQIRITGDEAGGAMVITGEADQRIEDDLTPRKDAWTGGEAQFRRQADPHGLSVFGANLGRSARHVGSRERASALASESTESGLAITGSAVGRSVRVTGDEDGACRSVTGSQYLTPARRQVACGGPSPAGAESHRPDPVTAGKVRIAQTWRGARVSGPDLEHDPRVTGEAHGTCATVTGAPYQGPLSLAKWCDPASADAAEARLLGGLGGRPSAIPVTGNAPVHGDRITGTGRGVGREISGTPYYRAAGPTAPAATVDAIDDRFSVSSPQRAAHLRTGSPDAGGDRVTGAFAAGHGKITGALDFVPRQALASDPANGAARDRITGEGRPGGAITGDAWTNATNITGVEGDFASRRNPSLRAGQPAVFAGARAFRADHGDDAPRQLVTGMSGFPSNAEARVTLSGGARG